MKKIFDMKKIFGIFQTMVIGIALAACTPSPKDVKPATEDLTIYPDYKDILIPCNIAPLNFMIRGDYDAVSVRLGNEQKIEKRGRKVLIDPEEWQKLTGNTREERVIYISVTARSSKDGGWYEFPSFTWTISPDSIDTFITYRLIEPGYEVWDKVEIEERCIENFTTRTLADGKRLGNRCMNCHTHGGDKGQYSFFHLRGQGGGTILNRDRRLRKVTLRNEEMTGGAVYGDFHPSGRFAVFSTNVIIPSFHSEGIRRFEVFDTSSDLCLADFDSSAMRLSPLVSNTASTLETFPCFSADGRWIYFCSAPNPCGDTIPSPYDLKDHVSDIHYSLYRIAFDDAEGTFGDEIETVYDAEAKGGSVNLPKCSPDGRWLMFSLSANGTFPIWHSETRLCLTDANGNSYTTEENGTYHSWSHNSRWIAFASKRYDGQYGRVYFAHINTAADGKSPVMSKPLVMPQADPEMDDLNLRSFNIPDLSNVATPIDTETINRLVEHTQAESFQ